MSAERRWWRGTRCGSWSTGVPERWRLYVHHRQKEYTRSMEQRVQGSAALGGGGGGGGSNFHSLLKTLPQINYMGKNVKLSSQGISQSQGTAFSRCPCCSVAACRWDRCEFLNIFLLFWCLMTYSPSGPDRAWPVQCSELILFSFFLCRVLGWEEFWLRSKVCVD